MNDEKLDQLIASALVSDATIGELEISAGEQMLLEEIMATTAPSAAPRPTSRRPRPNRHRLFDRPRLVAGLAVGGLVVAGGTAYAAVRALTTEQTTSIDVWNQLSANNPAGVCSLEPSDGQLVASTRYQGRTIEYWTFDSAAAHADVGFEDDEGGGGGGCSTGSRAVAHSELPWADYLLAVDGSGSTFTVFGQAPLGSTEAEIQFNNGTLTAEVEPNGYFVVVGVLPTLPDDTLISVVAR